MVQHWDIRKKLAHLVHIQIFQRIEDNCTLAEAIAANVGALFDENSRPFLKPWDFYPKLFEKEQEMYEEAEEERQWAEYSEKRREYVNEFNRRRHE